MNTVTARRYRSRKQSSFVCRLLFKKLSTLVLQLMVLACPLLAALSVGAWVEGSLGAGLAISLICVLSLVTYSTVKVLRSFAPEVFEADDE